MNAFILCLLLAFSSCANFVNSVHKQIEKEENNKRRNSLSSRNRFGTYKKDPRFNTADDRRPVNNPITYSLGSDSSGNFKPPVKRNYRPNRYQADDFKDNSDSGSLWANQGSSSSLFTYQNDKHRGDMVIINVLENLRNQISAELKRTFPDRPRKSGKELGSDAGKSAPPPPSPASTPGQDADMDIKVYDKISGTVLEEISKDYILLRGRKEVIYKKEKRSIEVQALVSRKDIMENDFVNSDKLLESKVFVLRGDE